VDLTGTEASPQAGLVVSGGAIVPEAAGGFCELVEWFD
jgi:hypothetical protein